MTEIKPTPLIDRETAHELLELLLPTEHIRDAHTNPQTLVDNCPQDLQGDLPPGYWEEFAQIAHGKFTELRKQQTEMLMFAIRPEWADDIRAALGDPRYSRVRDHLKELQTALGQRMWSWGVNIGAASLALIETKNRNRGGGQ